MKQSQKLFNHAQLIIPGGVNSPVRAFRSVGGIPPFIRRGRGSQIWDADGLHLGGEDGSLAAARARLGPGKWLGASCYRSLDNAERAIAEGADHIAFGSFFVSSVKPGAVRSTPALLTEAKQKFGVPVVAIGGITLGNAPRLIAAGADSVAVITALFGAPDVALAAQQFNALFANGGDSP